MGQLDSRTIIITGGSLGIGYAIAEKCVREGAQVIIAARNEGDLSNALIKLNKISEKEHLSYSLDVAELKEVREFAKWCESEKIELTGLVNCAGIYGPIGKTSDSMMEDFVHTICVNFLGTVQMCSLFAPLMKSDKKKKIVNLSGGGAASPFPHYSAYATSKIAIVRFTENLAIELSDEGIEVNAVAPGFVITRLHHETIKAGKSAAGEQFYENTKEQIESGGVSPEKAAQLCSFLLSDESDGISGKFLSAPWDPWQDEEFLNALKNDSDLATLRRIDNKFFVKKS